MGGMSAVVRLGGRFSAVRLDDGVTYSVTLPVWLVMPLLCAVLCKATLVLLGTALAKAASNSKARQTLDSRSKDHIIVTSYESRRMYAGSTRNIHAVVSQGHSVRKSLSVTTIHVRQRDSAVRALRNSLQVHTAQAYQFRRLQCTYAANATVLGSIDRISHVEP